MDPDLLRTLKALSDASRLRIVGMLAGRPMAVEELADALGLSAPTVAHHLKRLREAGLVEPRPRRPYVEYVLQRGRLQQIGRDLARASGEQTEPQAVAPGPDGNPRPAFDAKVLRAFFDGNRLLQIPTQEKKRAVVVRYLAETLLEAGRDYPERELNERLAEANEDFAALRRHLVDLGYMERDRRVYRLRPRADWPA
jgi:DNA-binding HxlR family transcriptional regulator